MLYVARMYEIKLYSTLSLGEVGGIAGSEKLAEWSFVDGNDEAVLQGNTIIFSQSLYIWCREVFSFVLKAD